MFASWDLQEQKPELELLLVLGGIDSSHHGTRDTNPKMSHVNLDVWNSMPSVPLTVQPDCTCSCESVSNKCDPFTSISTSPCLCLCSNVLMDLTSWKEIDRSNHLGSNTHYKTQISTQYYFHLWLFKRTPINTKTFKKFSPNNQTWLVLQYSVARLGALPSQMNCISNTVFGTKQSLGLFSLGQWTP